jgi:hypothetical protein
MMSLESLLAEEPPLTLQRQAVPGAVDTGGLPLHNLVDVRPVVGRLVRLGARQIAAWYALAVDATYEYISQDEGIENGDFLAGDGRLWRVVGTGAKVYAKGLIPTHTKYPLLEVRAR